MKATDLRIGNLLTDEFYPDFNTIITVESINEKGINLEIENSNDYPECQSHWIDPYYPFDNLRGIPLNESWFIKLGFKDRSGKLKNRMGYGIDINTMIEIAWYKIGDDVRLQSKGSGWTFNTHILYVHQLQNLYFSLTGKEIIAKAQ